MPRARHAPAARKPQPPHLKPTRAELAAAIHKTVPDVIAKDLRLLFCGINPGLYTAAIGHHFGRPGNRFWPALYAGGFTPRLLSPYEERALLKDGFGITNLVSRATVLAHELTREDLVAGGAVLRKKLRRYRPRMVAVLGVTSFRLAFAQPKAAVGPQAQPLAGVPVWVLPNPSGLNAHFTPKKLATLFRQLHAACPD